jgi:hypothetical protein
MSYQWLQMRITEEKDRRERERQIQLRLPRALGEVHGYLKNCLDAYTEEFGKLSATANLTDSKIHVVVSEKEGLDWQPRSTVEVKTVLDVPGFQIERSGQTFIIEVGMLPGDRIFYRDREFDQFLTVEELTRRILDRALFPKLRE